MQQQQQQQYKYPGPVQQNQQQRVLTKQSRQGRGQTLVANSIRPAIRTNAKQSAVNNGYNQQQTPIANYRQQQPPPVKQAGQMRNGGIQKNNLGS